jgi:hypothetical protein
MKKTILVAAFALICAVTFAGVDEPTIATGAAIIKKGESTFAVVYKGTEAATVRISIRDERDRLVFAETLRKVDGFIRPYDFSTLQRGSYSITIEGNGSKQVEQINYLEGKVEKRLFVTKLAGENRFLLSAHNSSVEPVTVRILDEQQKLLHQETRMASGNFAQVFRIENLKGGITFEIQRADGKTESISY